MHLTVCGTSGLVGASLHGEAPYTDGFPLHAVGLWARGLCGLLTTNMDNLPSSCRSSCGFLRVLRDLASKKFGFDFGLRCFCGVWSRFYPARHCLTGTRVDFDIGFSQTPGKCPITLIHSPYRVAVFIPRLAVRIPRPMRKDKNTL